MIHYRDRLFEYWGFLYPNIPDQILENFLQSVDVFRKNNQQTNSGSDWFKDAVVYSLYVDLFNSTFEGLMRKLDYFSELGINCLWLLPILDSPMRDGGFDISNYYSIRTDLTENNPAERDEVFSKFVREAHSRNIRVIFDIAINHISDQHPWFTEAKKSKDNPYRQFFIWSNTGTEFADARIIFKGIETSNWEPCGNQYCFHRFFSFQPDLNYRNPEVLFAMSRILLYWKNLGIDGFRADAIPYLWKEEGTPCENHPLTHVIVKFFRALMDYIQPGTLLLAEACQKPAKVVEYMGNGDECHAAYHFPLMPRIFKAIAEEKSAPVIEILDRSVTPEIPRGSQWFTFLRCHDELSLELVYVTEEERKYLHENYCRKPEWDFREGEGISARLAELLQHDSRKILLAYSLILTLPGTPVIYYGDEVGKINDEQYYRETIKMTGKDDSRFLVRGKMDWQEIEKSLRDDKSLASQIFFPLQKMIIHRNTSKAFGRGDFSIITGKNPELMVHTRSFENQKYLVIHNLSHKEISFGFGGYTADSADALGKPLQPTVEPYGFRWIRLTNQ